jgi:hypothetical protein
MYSTNHGSNTLVLGEDVLFGSYCLNSHMEKVQFLTEMRSARQWTRNVSHNKGDSCSLIAKS